MKDAIISLGAIAAGAYILTLDLRLWPISAIFAGFGVLAWFIFKAQDAAHARAVESKDLTEARSLFGGGLLVAVLFVVVLIMAIDQLNGAHP